MIYQYILSHLPLTCHGVAYVRVRRLVITTIGKMVSIDGKNLINESGTKTICCQIMALTFVDIYSTCASPLNICSTQEEILVSTEKEFDISLVLKKSCLRKLATSPRKLLYYLAAIRSQIDADKARPVDIQLVTDLRKTSF